MRWDTKSVALAYPELGKQLVNGHGHHVHSIHCQNALGLRHLWYIETAIRERASYVTAIFGMVTSHDTDSLNLELCLFACSSGVEAHVAFLRTGLAMKSEPDVLASTTVYSSPSVRRFNSPASLKTSYQKTCISEVC